MAKKCDFYFTRDDGVNVPELDLFDYTDRDKERVERKIAKTRAVQVMNYKDKSEVVGTVVVSEPREIEMGLSTVQFVMVHS